MLKQVYILIGLFAFSTKPAHAYLDPGSGSYLVQMLIASLVGGGVAIKTFWKNIKGLWLRKRNEKRA